MSVETLESGVQVDVDLEQVIPCGDPNHDHPADVIMRLACSRGCPVNVDAVCWFWYDWFFDGNPIYHAPCDVLIDPEKDVTVVEVLRPR